MDIIDIMLARAMTPQGQTDSYVAKANAAAAKAAQAEQDAAAAIATVNAAADEIAAAQTAASDLLAEAQETLETAQQAQINTLDIEDVDAEIRNFIMSPDMDTSNSSYSELWAVARYPDNFSASVPLLRMYKSTGNNEDATMTQKAITTAIDSAKTYVDTAIANIPSSGGSGTINLGTDAEGHLLTADENGNVVSSQLTEEDIVEALLYMGTYTAKDAVGLDIDYPNKIYSRIQEATNLSMGPDFDNYPMYGGRMRCNVSDDGTINAFYGDNNYADDGSNGQVMVYQPKFYYQRTPVVVDNINNGAIIRRESIIVSATKQPGFKLHPIFKGVNGEELDYVLLPAYDGSLVNDKLASVSGKKPLSNITVTQAESYAAARGTGWHITNMAAEAAQQMLEIVEFGTLNGQEALEEGISSIPNVVTNVNCSSLTGSTATKGNTTGHATTTTNEIKGVTKEYTTAGQRAITYRGVENPWGNLWRLIGGTNISGNGREQGGGVYICSDFNYTPSTNGSNYHFIGFYLPTDSSWISAFGMGDPAYDWVFMPAECSNGTSSGPVGDSLWVTSGLNGQNVIAIGGTYSFKDNDGPFYYACDRPTDNHAYNNFGANLMFIPTKNSIYENNITKWTQHYHGRVNIG